MLSTTRPARSPKLRKSCGLSTTRPGRSPKLRKSCVLSTTRPNRSPKLRNSCVLSTTRPDGSQKRLTYPFTCNSTGPPEWPSSITKAIREVLMIPCSTPTNPEFKFTMTREAAEHNFCVMSKYDKDLGKALED